MKVLVTGGAGFIGSNICLRLLNKGHEVICLDNLSTGYKYNIMEQMFNPKFNFILHDITEPYLAAKVDMIVHCATSDKKDPLHFLKSCSYGAFNVAGIARRNKARLIVLSSHEYYGNNVYRYNKIEEDSPAINDGDEASSGFQMMETIFKNYSSLDIRVLRVFDTYGPKMNPESFLGKTIRNIIDKKEVLILKRKEDIFSSCYIGDVVDAVSCAIEMDSFVGPLNIGSEKDIVVQDIIQKVNHMLEKDISIKYLDDYGGERPAGYHQNINYLPNVEKIKKVLKWKQKIDYNKGIGNTVNFFKDGPNRDYDLEDL